MNLISQFNGMSWLHLAILAAIVIFGISHRSQLKRITIEFKNGKDKKQTDETSAPDSGASH